MASLCQSRLVVVFARQLSTSVPRKVSATSAQVKEIGRLTPPLVEAAYTPGQMFIHRTFAYRGVVVCSFNSRFHERMEDDTSVCSNKDYYQVLIHRADWPHMMFPVDLTYYLQEGSTRGEKYIAVINGMDCPSHADILPYETNELLPIEHDLFDRIFMREGTEAGGKIVMRPQLKENYLASQRSWLAPRDVYRETTEGIEVTVATFYLGTNLIGGQQKHMWRYSIRIENHDPQRSVILRERSLKIYSLNNMNQANGHGVHGKQPELNVSTPAFQFSSTVELPHSKGGHMWGSFKMERDNGTAFNVTIPTVVLESQDEKPVEMEKAKE